MSRPPDHQHDESRYGPPEPATTKDVLHLLDRAEEGMKLALVQSRLSEMVGDLQDLARDGHDVYGRDLATFAAEVRAETIEILRATGGI